MRERRHVDHHGPLATESLPERLAGRVVGPMLHRHGPLHDGADALPHTPRRLGLVVPDGREDLQEVGRGDVGDELVADERERIHPKVFGQSAACLGLRHAPLFCFRTSAAACSKVGTPWWRRLAASGSPPERASMRLASACSRASASDTRE